MIPDYIPEWVKSITDDKQRHFTILRLMLDYNNTVYNTQEMCKNAKMLFEYVIKYDVITTFNHRRFDKILYTKLREFQTQNIPGPFNPKDWSLDVMDRLFPIENEINNVSVTDKE